MDIYDVHRKRLFLLNCVKQGVEPDWEMAASRWGTQFPVLQAAPLVEKLVAVGRAGPVWRKIEAQLERQAASHEEAVASLRRRPSLPGQPGPGCASSHGPRCFTGVLKDRSQFCCYLLLFAGVLRESVEF